MKMMPKTRLKEVEDSILTLLRYAKRRSGKAQIPVNDPDYAEAFGLHRGFIIAVYGKYSQTQTVGLPDGSVPTAHEWFRSLRERAEAEAAKAEAKGASSAPQS